MKLPSLIGLAGLSVLGLGPARADSTAPVDFAQRNPSLSPAVTVTPDKKLPARNGAVQDKRVEKNTVDMPSAAIGDRRAAITVEETRVKNVREKASSRPVAIEPTLSTFNHREAPFATATDATKPALVAKYQDSLKAASVTNMAKYPAIDRATTAKINRFVFRKNSPDPAPVTGNAPVTRAGSSQPDDVATKPGPPVLK